MMPTTIMRAAASSSGGVVMRAAAQQQQQQLVAPLRSSRCTSSSRSSRIAGAAAPGVRRAQRLLVARAAPLERAAVDAEEVADLIAAQPLDDEQRGALEVLTNTLGVPLGTAKTMVFKRRALLGMTAQEVLDGVRLVADIVGVTTDQAIAMATIQPGLLFDTRRNAEALAAGIRAICYELKAPKEEVVRLILENQSVLHGREMRLSVADIAHLAMLREPTGRVAE